MAISQQKLTGFRTFRVIRIMLINIIRMQNLLLLRLRAMQLNVRNLRFFKVTECVSFWPVVSQLAQTGSAAAMERFAQHSGVSVAQQRNSGKTEAIDPGGRLKIESPTGSSDEVVDPLTSAQHMPSETVSSDLDEILNQPIHSDLKKRVLGNKSKMQKTAKSSPDICRFCGKKYSSKRFRQWHELQQHYEEYSKKSDLYPDLVTVFNKKENDGLVCSCCNKIFATKEKKMNHEKWQAKKNAYTFLCQWCKTKFESEMKLKKHAYRKHREEADYVESPDLLEAFEILHDPKNRTCRFCKKKFMDANLCIHHENTVHCDEPNFVPRVVDWKAKIIPKAKKSSVTEGNLWKCHWCLQNFYSHHNLRRHKFVVHRNEPDYIEADEYVHKMILVSDPKNSTCRWCQKVFANIYICFQHEKEFHKDEPDYTPQLSLNELQKVAAVTGNLVEDPRDMIFPKYTPYRPHSKRAATEVRELENSLVLNLDTSVVSSVSRLETPQSSNRCGSLLQWSDQLTDVIIQYLNANLQDQTQRILLMNFGRSSLPKQIYKAGYKNLHIFEANAENIKSNWMGYEQLEDLKEEFGVHQMSFGRLASNWSYYAVSGQPNYLEKVLSQSMVTWDSFNTSETVEPDTLVLGFLNQEQTQRYFLQELIGSSLRQCRMLSKGPVRYLVFLNPRMYSIVMGCETSLTRKMSSWNLEMTMDARLVHKESMNSFKPSFRFPAFREREKIQLKQHGIDRKQLYLTEFTPKRDSELKFGSLPMARDHGTALLILQELTVRKLVTDDAKTLQTALRPWFPEADRVLEELGLHEKKILNLTKEDFAVVFQCVVLPHLLAHSQDHDSAFMREYDSYVTAQIEHRPNVDRIPKTEVYSGRKTKLSPF